MYVVYIVPYYIFLGNIIPTKTTKKYFSLSFTHTILSANFDLK